ncbi:hypothetical protein GUITHDRAFT_147185 [Guillardia theta CCMP2712]|uniref:Uncharacterized protein n=1 Tax=Guillardia theta (strain CCMP2712) TaxID=905079 RepID=L1IDY9_GUITC|nr:hypothetical protein GUITHDRAFT_147185 [Guillardia theta CCMP2712]EKX34486.1 hypothetical protein GUITHDRAFT_147185 [Guillardia theta CCMP2712]|eukprot:XP_005821466.1 hypothetical protein GUITHDRAFT_147185 [Guillardia theta CCMP2712]
MPSSSPQACTSPLPHQHRSPSSERPTDVECTAELLNVDAAKLHGLSREKQRQLKALAMSIRRRREGAWTERISRVSSTVGGGQGLRIRTGFELQQPAVCMSCRDQE